MTTKEENKKIEMESTSDKRYSGAVGRRKTAIARVRITPGSKMSFVINDKDVLDYFKTDDLRAIIKEAFTNAKVPGKFKITVKVLGGGSHSQAEAIRHGIARALLVYDIQLRGQLKKEGLLKRDPRAKERRKFGLKKARKAPQWSKR